ncbi:hypothetical protein NM688_g3021 [Phlebia brevispora]|uniref:Uncharacterized protein n=1 Tax=Phlebia brevispora TaxID=194682 RepID=A0ACC1T761_9APHY|nr:hypothetical protein NM688_g3021 [Phlebia brevispora]
MSVTFHSFQDASGLPANVDAVVQLLTRPCLDTQRIASLPCLTPIAAKQLQRIPAHPLSETVMNEKLLDVANLVLMASAGIEELVSRGDECGSRPTKPLWYTLLRSIARHCHKDMEIIGDTSFVYPKGFRGEKGLACMLATFAADESLIASSFEAERCTITDAVAIACLSDAVQCIDTAAGHSSPAESGVEEESTLNDSEDEKEEDSYSSEDSSYDKPRYHPILSANPTYWKPEYDEGELFFGLDHVDEHETPGGTWLDLPLDAHLLAGRRAWPVVSFPVLCVADAEEIIPLISSAVCQRAAWGIGIPVVGFEMSKFDSIVRVYIAWSDSSLGTEQMPSIQILRQDEDACKRSTVPLSSGFFDLSSPQSALELAHFILLLDHQLEDMRRELPSRHLQNLRWRSDDMDAAWAEDIEGWRTFVDQSDESSTSNSSYSHTSTSGHEYDSDMARKPKSEQVSRSAPPTLQGTAVQSRTKPQTEKLQGDAQTEDTRTKAFSASSFARVTQPSIDEGSSITTWMLHRWTFPIARIELPDSHLISAPPEFQRMLDIYNKVSRFEWIEGWKAVENIPLVDQCVMSYREKLFSAYGELQQYEPNPPFMETKQANLLQARLTLVFNSVDGAYTRGAREFNPLEAESRHDWDALLFNFYVDGDSRNATSPHVFLERTLRLPLNNFAHQAALPNHTEHVANLQERLLRWQAHNQEVSFHVDAHFTQDQQLRQQCSQAWEAGFSLLSRFRALNRDPTQFRSRVQAQAKTEPVTSKCDAILVTSVPISLEGVAKPKTVLRSYKKFRLAYIDEGNGSVAPKISTTAAQPPETSLNPKEDGEDFDQDSEAEDADEDPKDAAPPGRESRT